MTSPGEGFTLDRLFYSLGYTLEEARGLLEDGELGATTAVIDDSDPGRASDREAVETDASAPRLAIATAAETGEPDSMSYGPGSAFSDSRTTLAAGAAGWLIARIFRPRRVRWPRVILAGIVATALAELTGLLTPDDEVGPPVFPPRPEDLPRYSAGVITAAVYASIFYPRLPGSALMRGVTFGAIEAATSQVGGTVGLLRRVAPDTPVPLDSFVTPGLPRVSPLAGLAYGVGLSLYSSKR